MWEIFFFKNHAENEAGRLVPDLFFFKKKAVYKVKSVVRTLAVIYFGRLSNKNKLGHTIKTNFITFHTVDQRYAQFWYKFIYA